MISTAIRSEQIELETGSRAAMLITCVHQGYELYGSDRCFIETVHAIRATFPAADIEVVLPSGGPIIAPLEGVASRITIEPLWVLRRRDLKRLATIGLLRLPSAVFRALRRIRRSDLVYVNTTVVADYILAARFCPGRTIIHVHEIPGARVLPVLRALVRWSRADVIFNSRASRSAFAIVRSSLPDAAAAVVIYNGVAGPAHPEPQTFDGTRRLRLLMLGRISRIKGQEVLVDALAMLPPHLRPEVRIVGNAFEDDARERDLAASIDRAGLATDVTLQPFTPDPSALYRWSDVVVVPSRLPESLGRVAIEAMAFGRPPLASAIGGLMEVVADGETGWLVEPGSAEALAHALRHLIEHHEDWRSFPEAARRRYETLFGETAAQAAIKAVMLETLDRRERRRAPA